MLMSLALDADAAAARRSFTADAGLMPLLRHALTRMQEECPALALRHGKVCRWRAVETHCKRASRLRTYKFDWAARGSRARSADHSLLVRKAYVAVMPMSAI
jgi:hypothetical protein